MNSLDKRDYHTIGVVLAISSLFVFLFPIYNVNAQTPNSTSPSPGSEQPSSTILKLDSIPSPPPDQSVTVSGSLTDSNSGKGIGSAEITLDGTGVTDPKCDLTSSDGSFTCTFTTPNTIATGWSVKAHFRGFPSLEFGPGPSDSNVITYDTISSTTPFPSPSPSPGPSPSPPPPAPTADMILFGIVAIIIVALIIFGLYKKIRNSDRTKQNGPIVDVDVRGGLD